MARASSVRRKAKGFLWEWTNNATILGLKVGGGLFIAVSIYLLWGIIAGSLSKAGFLGGDDLRRVMENVQLACKALIASGIIIIVSSSVRFYLDDFTGYYFLVAGAALRWGMPVLVGASIGEITFKAATLPAYVARQYSTVGTALLVTAAPFILIDFVRRIKDARRLAKRSAMTVRFDDEEDDLPKGKLCILCWQMPYCRSYLRRYCQAYERRRPCWQIKIGCYCDEDMILRMMKRSSGSTVGGKDQTFAWLAGSQGKKKDLTAAQKRQRCRDCSLYQDHQREKYQLLGWLAFPSTIGIMYMFYRPIKAGLHEGLNFTDQFARRLSYGTVPTADQSWVNSPAASDTVETLFLMCLGLILVTYILRAIEYLVFEVQV